MPVLEHGHSGGKGKRRSGTYSSWRDAKARCFNQSHRTYTLYGGRGITMCDRWRTSFAAFLADMGECPPGLTLDRIDNNGNYQPGNCRWATRHEQQQNRRDNRLVELDGVHMTLTEAADRFGLPRTIISGRLRHGWSDAEAVNPNFVRPERLIEYEGQRMTIAQVARRTGLHKNTLRNRLLRGWSDAEAVNPNLRPRRIHV
jgi:hypothetical protein